MHIVHRTALVPYSAAEMFALVDDVESYPDFLPWCNDAELHQRDAHSVEATLEMHRHGVSRHFRTRNTFTVNESMEINLVDGPFRHLHGRWQFLQLNNAGCKVSLEMQFEFAGRMLDAVFGRFFEDTCTSLVDAFTARAVKIYGAKRGFDV